MCGEMADNGG
uniref:Uncharacterized protein n=1 Tax=Anguilla anguilla TaxID=7936 RepID=A0A0E9S3R4_ANGAN